MEVMEAMKPFLSRKLMQRISICILVIDSIVSSLPLAFAQSPPPPTPTAAAEVSVSEWLSVGSQEPLDPETDLGGCLGPMDLPTSEQWNYRLQLRPNIDSEYLDKSLATPTSTGIPPVLEHPYSKGNPLNPGNPRGVSYFTQYAPLNVQAIFDFPQYNGPASPTPTPIPISNVSLTLSGSVSSVVGEGTSSLIGTIIPSGGPINPDRFKHLIGTSLYAISTRGGADFNKWSGADAFHVLGSGNFAVTALRDAASIEAENAEDPDSWKFMRCYVDTVCGQENRAMISPDREDYDDFRKIGTATESIALSNPVVRTLAGSTSSILIDQKRFSDDSISPAIRFFEEDEDDIGGQMFKAIGHWARIVNFVAGQFINIGRLRAIRVAFDFVESHADGVVSEGSREGSRIRHLVGMHVRAPQFDSKANITVGETIGMVIAPPLNTGLNASEYPSGKSNLTGTLSFVRSDSGDTIPLRASILADGDMVIGDGNARLEQSGYNTDILHCRDVLQFGTMIPADSELEQLPIWDRVGIVAFGTPSDYDVEGLYVTVPSNSWVEGNPGTGVTWVLIALADASDLSMDTEQIGVSVYALDIDLDAGELRVMSELRGAGVTPPIIRWRQIWQAPGRQALPFCTPWEQITLEQTKGIYREQEDVVAVEMEIEPDVRRIPSIIEFVVVHPETGRAASSSFALK